MQIEHKTEKGTVIFIKVPEDAYEFDNNMAPHQINFIVDTPFNGGVLKFGEAIILRDHWNEQLNLIGLTSEVTEEQAKMIVDKSERHEDMFIDYTSDSTRFVYLFNSALNSFKSLMQHLQVYEVNPYGKVPECGCMGPSEDCKGCDDWINAESRTGKWIVLFKSN